MTADEAGALMRSATKSCFTIENKDGGIMLSWGDDPLDYIWQTHAQAIDLAMKLNKAFANV